MNVLALPVKRWGSPNYHFTFCGNQIGPKGQPLANRYMTIPAEDRSAARKIVFDAIGSNWGFCYDDEEFEGQVERFLLKEITLEELHVKK